MTVQQFYRMSVAMGLAVVVVGGCARLGETEGHAHGEACDHDRGAEAQPAIPEAHAHGEACDHDHDEAESKSAEEEGHAHGEACDQDHSEAEGGDAIDLPAGAAKLLGMTFATVTRRAVAGTARFPGRFEWEPDACRVYPVPVGGRIELRVRTMQRVEPGTVLFVLRSPAWAELCGAVREAEAGVAFARSEADAVRARLMPLREAGVRHAELEMALAVKEAEGVRAERTLEAAEGRRRIVLALCREADGALEFVAEEQGVVESLEALPGAWVEAGAKVAVVVRPERIRFRADGLEPELGAVRDGMSGFVEPLKGVGSADERAAGRIELGLAVHAATRSRPVYLRPFEVAPWMVSGRSGVLSVPVEVSAEGALAVPSGCVVADGLRSVVFVRDSAAGDRYRVCEVGVGASDGDWTEIRGVAAGATVVLHGAYELKLAVPSAAAPRKTAGHFHADGQFHEGAH